VRWSTWSSKSTEGVIIVFISAFVVVAYILVLVVFTTIVIRMWNLFVGSIYGRIDIFA
jgi:hypothetical protein